VLIAGAVYFHLGRAPVQLSDQLAKPSERFSIVVLPFANLSGDANQDYLADVISDELTTGLSSFRESLVISRSTAFTYKGKPINVRQIGKDLGVRYALVPRRSDFDWLRAGHSSSGSRPGSTRSSMLRAARGCLLMKPSRSSVSTIW
jgi:hypothetical protein